MRDFDCFLKIAATRWKKEMENLSDKNKKALRTKVAKSPQKIVNGIEEGNRNLTERLNIHVAGKKKNIKQYLKDNTTLGRAARNVMSNIIKNESPASTISNKFSSSSLNKSDEDKAAVIMGFRKCDSDTNGATFKVKTNRVQNIVRPNNSNDLELRAVDALVFRHEIDEVRDMMKNGVSSHKYGTHNSPGVIHRESAVLSLMPERVRDKIVSVRKSAYEAQPLEAFGVQYGESPYYNREKAKKHMNNWFGRK